MEKAAAAQVKINSSIMNLKSIRRNTMYRKTIITTITLLVAAIALSAAAFGAAQNCCKANAENCCAAAENCCGAAQSCCVSMRRPGATSGAVAEATLQNDTQTATVEITDKGYEPSSLKLKAGAPAKVTFVRKTDATCAKEVVIKEYNINRKLPLNEQVTVEFTPRKGEFSFACGMDMIKGTLIVE
jgi:plastocyanin